MAKLPINRYFAGLGILGNLATFGVFIMAVLETLFPVRQVVLQ
jgi:hypothetical protein